jgi:hypothetical protein
VPDLPRSAVDPEHRYLALFALDREDGVKGTSPEAMMRRHPGELPFTGLGEADHSAIASWTRRL